MSFLDKWKNELKKDPEFLALEKEIVETHQRLDDLMQRLNNSFPPEGMRMWQLRGSKDGGLLLVPLLVEIPENDEEERGG